MNIYVLYQSKTGNTKKVAQAIAQALGVEAQSIQSVKNLSNADIVFLGDGNYKGRYSSAMDQFIDQHLKNVSVKHIVLFGTYGGLTNAMQKLRTKLVGLNFSVASEEFGARGQTWLFINTFHPKKETLEQAGIFAKTMKDKYL